MKFLHRTSKKIQHRGIIFGCANWPPAFSVQQRHNVMLVASHWRTIRFDGVRICGDAIESMRELKKLRGASIQATPSSIQFGKVVSGVPYSQSVRLFNTGSTDSTNHTGCDIWRGIQRFWAFPSDDASGRAKCDVYSGISFEGQWWRIRRHHGGRRRR